MKGKYKIKWNGVWTYFNNETEVSNLKAKGFKFLEWNIHTKRYKKSK
jgi:hypothetical protein